MDSQEETILRAIVISSSSSWSGQPIAPSDRQTAYSVLDEFSKFQGRLPMCLSWLQKPQLIVGGNNDCTVAAKLFACETLAKMLKTDYSKLPEKDRLTLRGALLTAARQQAQNPIIDPRVLPNKLASLLAALMVRDFPQRWTTCIDDLFGNLWSAEVPQMGNKICLEILKLVAEDCTDSDFNVKISTKRRNDILIGLNEISSHFLPLLFRSLELTVTLTQAKSSIHQMRGYLLQNNQTLATMTPEQRAAYQQEESKIRGLSMVMVDTLTTLEKFCRSMPLDWILNSKHDFSAAFFHLIREPTENIQVLALDCLHQLCLRGKISYNQWMKWVADLPQAIQQANQTVSLEQEYKQFSAAVSGRGGESSDPLTDQISYHRGLSQMLSTLVASHLSHLTHDKRILKRQSQDRTTFSNFLRFLVDMLHHPSGLICGTQLNLWISMLRDPQITRAKLLQPFVSELLTCYMDQMLRIRWSDVEDQIHPRSSLMEASWDDEDEYYNWLMDFRSKASQLFRHLGNSEPAIMSSVLLHRVQTLLSAHAYGEPRNYLHPSNQQLTQKSEAVRQLEGLVQPLENVLLGMPSWSLSVPPNETPGNRQELRAQTQSHLSELARVVVNWNPTYLWLKFRRAQLLECLRHYWKYEPSTLLQGVNSLLTYIGTPDEWGEGKVEIDGSTRLSGEIVSLRKKSSMVLVSVSKKVPQHLVHYISELSGITRSLLSSADILQTNRMHLYEFLTCVATSVEDPSQRSNFVANVLSDAINIIGSQESQDALASVDNFLAFIGVSQAAQNPACVTDPINVKTVSDRFTRLFSAFNQLLSVGKRCHEANKKRPNGGIPQLPSMPQISADPNNQHFPDEGPVSLQDLSVGDPFVPLWVQILPALLKMLDVVMRMWRPEHQASLLRDRVQRYSLAISDDEAYLSRKQDGKSGGVFGEGGTAGSVISGTDRRDLNLAPRWSGWLNELRNSCFQMLGLLSAQRVLFAPEIAHMFPRFVEVVVDAQNLRAMEHRHCSQYLKQFVEILLLTCPKTLYMTHLAPIVGPIFEHMQIRLDKMWGPILQSTAGSSQLCKPLSTNDCEAMASLASRGGEDWFTSYYARSGVFVGELDLVTAEAAVEKFRVEVTRTFSDALQSALALKGDWALTLANISKEEQARKNAKPVKGPPNRFTEGLINADGTPKSKNQAAIDARKLARISAMCHFLFLEHEQIAGSVTLIIIQCLAYPDAYTCRRITRICHRCLETVAWHPRYAELMGARMFSYAVKNIVMEPKWMVGIEWDMINVIRDIYCRLVLGQVVQPGGQGAGLQQPPVTENPIVYEQAKTADRPLQGGGILTTPSDFPKQIFASLQGITVQMIQQLDQDLKRKRAAKDQKDLIRDLLRIAAANWDESHPNSGVGSGVGTDSFERAVSGESLLRSSLRKKDVEDIPEKLVTHSMKYKSNGQKVGTAGFHLS